MADVVKALVLVVHSAAAWVRVLAESGTKMGHWDGPLHIRCPNDSNAACGCLQHHYRKQSDAGDVGESHYLVHNKTVCKDTFIFICK